MIPPSLLTKKKSKSCTNNMNYYCSSISRDCSMTIILYSRSAGNCSFIFSESRYNDSLIFTSYSGSSIYQYPDSIIRTLVK